MTTRPIEARIKGRWKLAQEVERTESVVTVLYDGRFYHLPPERIRERKKRR